MKSNIAQAMAEVMALASNKVNPTIINRLTHMWQVIHVSQVLSNAFPKYLKAIEIAMVHVLGFVEDERGFNSLAFLKNKV
jgi:reverse gyrase